MWRDRLVMAAIGLLTSALVVPGSAAADPAAGAKLAAARCVSCHSSTDTTHSILPLLEGQPKAYFIAQWRAFRERERTAPVMAGLTSELREDQVNDLAEYYAAPKPLEATWGAHWLIVCNAPIATVQRCREQARALHASPGKGRATPRGPCSLCAAATARMPKQSPIRGLPASATRRSMRLRRTLSTSGDRAQSTHYRFRQ